MTSPAPPAVAGRRGRAVLAVPLVLFCGLAALLFTRLGAGDPALVPSALIGRPAPALALPPLPGLGVPGLGEADLKAGHVTVLNVFASWCVECHDEHAALLELGDDPAFRAAGASLAGLLYKDDPGNARRYLGAKGNPFARVGVDPGGRAGIDFGVYGVPETFVIRGDGVVAYKLVGGVTPESRPALLAAVRAAAQATVGPTAPPNPPAGG